MPRAIYIDAKGNQFEADIPVGQNLMEGAVDNMIDGILGECGGVMACATCHVYVAKEWQDKIPPATEREDDMIDMAIEPEENSRLSCQIEMTEALDGITVYLPRSQF